MSQLLTVVSAVGGAAFTVSVCVALGSLLLRRLRLDFHRLEHGLFAFAGGSACLSLAVFFLCVIHEARLVVFLTGGCIAIGGAIWAGRRGKARERLPPLARVWQVFFGVVFAAFFVCYFVNALAPEISPDGSSYHLGNVARDWRHHGFDWGFHSIYASFPQGMEMLFLVAFSIGRHSAAALVHMAFQSALPLLMLCYGRRFGFPRAGAAAGLLIYASPVVGIDGISAYNDLTVATLIFAGFYLLQETSDISVDNRLLLIGLLAGFAFAVKYTAGLAVLLAIVLSRGRRATVLAAGAVLMAGPWMIRNWFWLHNPTAPFLNFWFSNPFWTASSEHQYLDGLAQYPPFQSHLNLILQLTVLGGLVPGMTGPAFLFLPLALLAIRFPHGRKLLLAGAVYAIPAFLNTEIRFLIPALPFFALAMGLALESSWGALPAVALFQSVLCWPAVLDVYCDRNAWRLREVPVRAALRLQPEPQYIAAHVGDYALKGAIDQNVPEGQRIFSFAGRAAAYLDRDIVVGYESTEGQRLQDALNNGDLAPVKAAGIHFLLIDDADYFAQRLKQDSKIGSLTEVARSHETALYRLD